MNCVVECKPAERKPADSRAADGTSAEGTPADGTPAEGFRGPADGRPADGTPDRWLVGFGFPWFQICNLGPHAFGNIGHQKIRGNLDGSGASSVGAWRIHTPRYQYYGFRLPHI